MNYRLLAFLGYISEPLPPVRLTQVMLLGVIVNTAIIELWSVPTADPVISPEIPADCEVVGCCLIPLGENEHVLALLPSDPVHRLLGAQRLVVS